MRSTVATPGRALLAGEAAAAPLTTSWPAEAQAHLLRTQDLGGPHCRPLIWEKTHAFDHTQPCPHPAAELLDGTAGLKPRKWVPPLCSVHRESPASLHTMNTGGPGSTAQALTGGSLGDLLSTNPGRGLAAGAAQSSHHAWENEARCQGPWGWPQPRGGLTSSKAKGQRREPKRSTGPTPSLYTQKRQAGEAVPHAQPPARRRASRRVRQVLVSLAM